MWRVEFSSLKSKLNYAREIKRIRIRCHGSFAPKYCKFLRKKISRKELVKKFWWSFFANYICRCILCISPIITRNVFCNAIVLETSARYPRRDQCTKFSGCSIANILLSRSNNKVSNDSSMRSLPGERFRVTRFLVFFFSHSHHIGVDLKARKSAFKFHTYRAIHVHDENNIQVALQLGVSRRAQSLASSALAAFHSFFYKITRKIFVFRNKYTSLAVILLHDCFGILSLIQPTKRYNTHRSVNPSFLYSFVYTAD